MAGFSLPNVDGLTTLEQVKNAVGIMTKELSWLMNNIDWKNVNELNIPLNGGGSVVIHDGGITVNNGVMDTFTVAIDGKVTMTSALIQSAAEYPKIIMDPESELFGAYKSATEFIKMEAFDVTNTSPQLGFVGGSSGMYLAQIGPVSRILTLNSRLDITVGGNLNFDLSNPFDSIRMDFVQLLDSSTSLTLYQQLLGKANNDESGYNLAFDNATRNLKMFAKNGDLLAQVNIP